jgi:hypothetical protein
MVLTHQEALTQRVRTWLTGEHPGLIVAKVGYVTRQAGPLRPGGVGVSDERAEWLAHQLQAYTARALASTPAPSIAGEFIRDALSEVDWSDLAWDYLSWDSPVVSTEESRS